MRPKSLQSFKSKTCEICGKEFVPNSAIQKVCSKECRREKFRRKDKARWPKRKEKKRLYDIGYRERNKERLKVSGKAYREAHKEELKARRNPYFDGRKPLKKAYDAARYPSVCEKAKERARNRYQKDPKAVAEKTAQWAKNHPDLVKTYARKSSRRRCAKMKKLQQQRVDNVKFVSESEFRSDMQQHASMLASAGIMSI